MVQISHELGKIVHVGDSRVVVNLDKSIQDAACEFGELLCQIPNQHEVLSGSGSYTEGTISGCYGTFRTAMSPVDSYDLAMKLVWNDGEMRETLAKYLTDFEASGKLSCEETRYLRRALDGREVVPHPSRWGIYSTTHNQPLSNDQKGRAVLQFCFSAPPIEEKLFEFKSAWAITISQPLGWPIENSPQALREHMTVVAGSSLNAIEAVVSAVSNQGDVVLVPQGSFDLFGSVITDAGAIPWYILLDDNNFVLTPERLTEVIQGSGGKKVSALLLASPTNPIGYVYSHSEVEALGQVCRKHGVTLILDELYGPFRSSIGQDGEQTTAFPSASTPEALSSKYSAELWNNAVVICGTSKLLGTDKGKAGIVCSGNTGLVKKVAAWSQKQDEKLTIGQVYALEAGLAKSLEVLPLRKFGIQRSFEDFKLLVNQFNEAVGFPCLSLPVQRAAGFFALLCFDRETFAKVGVRNSVELSRYLLSGTDTIYRDTAGMLLTHFDGKIPVRFNFSGPLQTSLLAFSRLRDVVVSIRKGRGKKYEP